MKAEKIDKTIRKLVEDRKDEIIKFLQKMINFDSEIIDMGKRGKEGPIQRWLANKFKKKPT